MPSSDCTASVIVAQATPYLPALNAGPAMNRSGSYFLTISSIAAFASSMFSPKYESPHTIVATISASPLN